MNALRFVRRLRFLSERRRFELYPPFFLMRVKVLEMSGNRRRMRLKLPLTWASRNMGGSMFGGYQAALADPIAPLACAAVFPGYAVWTRHLELDFIKEGAGDLELRFDFSPEQERAIRAQLESRERSTPTFEYGYYLPDGSLCTRIRCRVAIRPRGYVPRARSSATTSTQAS